MHGALGGDGGVLTGRPASVSSEASSTKAEVVEQLKEQAREALKTMLRTRSMLGCPVNLPFTDTDEILYRVSCCNSLFFNYRSYLYLQVKAMAIHEVKHPEVQFILSVRAFPLFNGMLSLWVFLGTLEANALKLT